MQLRLASRRTGAAPGQRATRRALWPRVNRRLSSLLLLLSASQLAGSAQAEPVVHEYFEPDPREDVALKATSFDGQLPAALQTRSGTVPAPAIDAEPSGAAEVYAREARASQKYQVDRDTTRPELVSYSDPFTPAIPPFKRLFAYDSVDRGFELVVKKERLRELGIGGEAHREDDQFYADLEVELSRGSEVRIPSVGPGARVLVAQSQPEVGFSLLRDRADNWFIQSAHEGRVRLVLQLAIDRRSFSAKFGEVPWARLKALLPSPPPEVVAAAADVARQIGISAQDSPRVALAHLVAHFRSFSASEELPQQGAGAQLYRELSLAKKGVCRHRAYAFVVTALGIGLPARFVHNEAHAWVEVSDGSLWYRIDLGGAASRVALNVEERPNHVQPKDPFAWPPGSGSAEGMTERALRARESERASAARSRDPIGRNSSVQEFNSGDSSGMAGTPGVASQTTAEQSSASVAGLSTLTVGVAQGEARRGSRVAVSGTLSFSGRPCGGVRVDVALSTDDERYPLGTLVTNQDGSYVGHLVIPYTVPVGDYSISVSTPGRSQVCGPGAAQ